MMESTISMLCSLVKSELEKVGCELVDLELKNVSQSNLIRVYADRAGGVTLNEITEATKGIRDRLDQTGMFGANYRLEVSSPGSSRSLRGEGELERFPGRVVKLYLKDGGTKVGAVAQVTVRAVELKTEAGEIEEIERDCIEDMHLLFSCN
ncbi:MAG: ribosome maturation factor RimP [bacterium]